MFGGPQTNTQAPGSGLFGNAQPSLGMQQPQPGWGQAAAPQSQFGGLGGAQQNNNNTAGAFGVNNNQSSLFGQKKPEEAKIGGLFGQPAANNNVSQFGAAPQ